jgi:hypothetical protein
MAKDIKAQNDWINSLLIQNLVQPGEEDSVDLKSCRAQIEESQMTERMRQMVADINRAAGYYMLELHEFLPPQPTILRIGFSKRFAEYFLEIVARDGDPAAVVFYSLSKISELWEQCFPTLSRLRKPSISLELDILPAEILNDDLQRWFTYLLSGFKNKFKPRAARHISEKGYNEFNAAARKKSA